MYFDPLYMVVMGIGMALGLWAQFKVKGPFTRFSRVASMSRLTGADVGRGASWPPTTSPTSRSSPSRAT